MNQTNISLEAVIEGLECHKRAMYGEIDEHGIACNLCPYKDMESTCHSRTEGSLIADALALLKKQQPVKPLIANDMYFCGSCKYAIPRTANYCPKCGKKVEWGA